MSRRALRTDAAGFTLVELVVVMAVLTVLSGLILPKLDVFKLKANKAQAASNMHGINRFLEGYKAQRDVYPDGLDSLFDSTTNTSLFSKLDPQLLGPSPNPNKLTTTTIATPEELRSITRVGITTVYDHDVNAGIVGDSAVGTPARALQVGDTVATINTADPDGQAIIAKFYPQTGTVPAGRKVIVFGLGPRNALIGDSLHTAPFYANTDQLKYYNRFLLAFELKDSGSRARFLGSLGSDADPLDDEIADFYGN